MNCKLRIVNCKSFLAQSTLREKRARGENQEVLAKKLIITQRTLVDLRDLCVIKDSQLAIPQLEIL